MIMFKMTMGMKMMKIVVVIKMMNKNNVVDNEDNDGNNIES